MFNAKLFTIFAIGLSSMLLSTHSGIAAAKKSSKFCKTSSGVEMVDTAFPVTDSFVGKMQKIGVKTIGRYFDYENETLPGKRLRPKELPIFKKYNMSHVVIFQHNNNKVSTFLNWKKRGPADAERALKMSTDINQPGGSAIYFGVDGDFVGKLSNVKFYTDEVIGYFREIKRKFQVENADYKIGVYGSGAACRTLKSKGLISYCWLSHSHGFFGTKDVLMTGDYHLEQYLPGNCGGRSIDFSDDNTPSGEYGQFILN